MPESLPGSFSPAKTRAALAGRGMTVADLDKLSGMCTPAGFWLTGRAVPTSPLIGYFARLIGCDPADLTDPGQPGTIAAEDSRCLEIITAGPPLEPATRTTLRKLLAGAGTVTQ